MGTWFHRLIAVLLGVLVGLALLPLLAPLIGFEPPLFRAEDPIDDTWCGGVVFSSDEGAYDWTHSQWEDDLLEVVFRHQFTNNPANPEAVERADFVFIALKGPDGLIDPSPELLARLADLSSIEPASMSELSIRGTVRRREHEGRSIMFVIDHLQPIDDSSIEVETIYRGGCASGNSYRVEQQDGEWVVVEARVRWIS